MSIFVTLCNIIFWLYFLTNTAEGNRRFSGNHQTNRRGYRPNRPGNDNFRPHNNNNFYRPGSGSPHYYNNQNHGLVPFHTPNIVDSCDQPVFEDADFEISHCVNRSSQYFRHAVCFNAQEGVPVNWKAKMVCQRNNQILKFSSFCTTEGNWFPEFLDNCNQLFELQASNIEGAVDNRNGDPEQEEETTTSYQPVGYACRMLKIRLSRNFVLTCLKPGFSKDTSDQCAQTDQSVSSGTKVFLKCKPPFVSSTNEYSKWACEDGKWNGNMEKMTCVYVQPIQSTNGNTQVLPNTGEDIYVRPPTFDVLDQGQDHYHPIDESTRTPTEDYEWFSTESPTTTTTVQPIFYSSKRPPTPTLGNRIMCPPLTTRSKGIQIECIFSGVQGSNVYSSTCSGLSVVGTEATYKCREYYESSYSLSILYRNCKEDGTWTGSSDSFTCVAQCGKANALLSPRITNGVATYRSQWPWHASLFLKEKNGLWKYICGGTVLSARAVITAGHCVTFIQSRQTRDPTTIRVELAKYKREERDEFVQIKQVKTITIYDSYNPFNYESDIAILILNDEITFGFHVRPVCFPQTPDSALEEQQLEPNSVGLVLGFGYDENGNLADELEMAQLKVVSQRECTEVDGGELSSRSTTYCAGLKNKTNVCNGDSGGGMVFPLKSAESIRYYLQGIVSAGISDDGGKCDPQKYSVFTRVGRYASWIIRTLSHHDVF